MRFRFHDRPYNKYDKACVAGGLAANSQAIPNSPIQTPSDEPFAAPGGYSLVYDGTYTTFRPEDFGIYFFSKKLIMLSQILSFQTCGVS